MSRAIALVVVGIASVQLGATFSKHLFGIVSPTTMVWLRLLISTVVLVAVARPRLRKKSRDALLTVLAFGLALAGMNWSIYESFARIPLGLAVTFEFIGPLAVALWGSRRARDLVWVALAGVGVALLGLRGQSLTIPGVLFALSAAVFWSMYILLSQRTGARWPGISGLAVASLVGTALMTPFALLSDAPALGHGRVWAFGTVVGLLSSVVPYSCELVALRTLPSRVFGILMSLEPAAAALLALVVLGEVLTLPQWLAIGCVVVASIGATRSAATGYAEPAPN